MVQILWDRRWSFEELIETWVGIRVHADFRVAHKRYHKQRQRQDAETRALRNLAGITIVRRSRTALGVRGSLTDLSRS